MPEVFSDQTVSSKRSNSEFKRTPPNCARCKNHGVKNILSGHKRYCMYLKCVCEKCQVTAERQRSMARNTAYRRAERQHQKKMEEWRKLVEKARENGEEAPEEPPELLSPFMSPKPRSGYSSEYGSERNLSSPKSDQDSKSVSPAIPKSDSRLPLNFTYRDEASTSDRVDLRSSLRSLQELLLHDHYPLEISSLLYLILKDTPEPKKAYSRIIEAQAELNSSYPREEIGKSPVDWSLPSYLRPSLFAPSLLLNHPAFSFSSPYYNPPNKYSTVNTPLPLPPACHYPPYLSTISSLRSPSDFLSCAPLTFPEEKPKHRLSFEPIQLTKDTRPSNLCIRETSSSFSLLENKFSVSEAK